MFDFFISESFKIKQQKKSKDSDKKQMIGACDYRDIETVELVAKLFFHILLFVVVNEQLYTVCLQRLT